MENVNQEYYNNGRQDICKDYYDLPERYKTYYENGFRKSNAVRKHTQTGMVQNRYNEYNSKINYSTPLYGHNYPKGYNDNNQFGPLINQKEYYEYKNALKDQKDDNYYLPRECYMSNPSVDNLYNRTIDSFQKKNKLRNINNSLSIQEEINQRYSNSLAKPSRNGRRIKKRMKSCKMRTTYNDSYTPKAVIEPGGSYYDEEGNYYIDPLYNINKNDYPPENYNPRFCHFGITNVPDDNERRINGLRNVAYSVPGEITGFHKKQIFNNYKPFLVESHQDLINKYYCLAELENQKDNDKYTSYINEKNRPKINSRLNSNYKFYNTQNGFYKNQIFDNFRPSLSDQFDNFEEDY